MTNKSGNNTHSCFAPCYTGNQVFMPHANNTNIWKKKSEEFTITYTNSHSTVLESHQRQESQRHKITILHHINLLPELFTGRDTLIVSHVDKLAPISYNYKCWLCITVPRPEAFVHAIEHSRCNYRHIFLLVSVNTSVCVPAISTVWPRKKCGEWWEQVVEGPCNDHVIVYADNTRAN